jgi:hypothetical protein
MSDNEIVCLATTSSSSVAARWRAALEAEGIECQVGEEMTVWIDNVAGQQADVWVHRANVQRAQEVLDACLAR